MEPDKKYSHSAESRAKMSASHMGKPSNRLGKKCSPETIAKMSAARKGKPSNMLGKKHSPSARAKISLAGIGRKTSQETKDKLAEIFKDRLVSPETRAKMSTSQAGNKNCLGRKLSVETKSKISAANIGRVVSVETRAKISSGKTGHSTSEETRRKRSISMRGKNKYKRTEETRAKMSKAKIGHTESEETKANRSRRWTGSGNPRWVGGVSAEGSRRIGNYLWKRLRKEILERDNYTCQCCEKSTDVKFQVHHKVPWRLTHNDGKENLVTLCMSCHTKIDCMFKRIVEPFLIERK
jgi:hypothetical protein